MIELQSTTIYLRDIEDGEEEKYEEYEGELRAGWYIPSSISTLLLELFDPSVVVHTAIPYRIVPTDTLYYTNYMPSHIN